MANYTGNKTMTNITKIEELEIQIVALAVQAGALRHACIQALELLQDGDAEAKDADRVEKLLETVLMG
jgi:hypothetical protein